MRIITVCPLYPEFGGLETHVREISERLAKKGCDIEVICTDPWNKYPKMEYENNITVTRFPAYAPNNAFFIAPRITSYLNSIQDADIIHVHGYNALPSYFASLTNNLAKFIYTPHYHRGGHTFLRNLLHYPYRIFAKNTFKRANKIICVSKYEKNLLLSDFDIPESKITVIPNGINTSEFKNNYPKNPQKTILYVGRLEKYKNIQEIIKALPYLPDYELNIVGKGSYEQALYKIAIELNVLNKLHFHEYLTRENLLKCYASSTVFAMLSDHEAFSIATAEALASGTNCIVTKRLMLEEYIDPNHCIGVNYPEDIIKAVRKFENKPYGAMYYGKDWNEITNSTLKLYEEVLK